VLPTLKINEHNMCIFASTYILAVARKARDRFDTSSQYILG
jgi:hypothetical protein